MKNVVKMQLGYFRWEREAALREFAVYYKNERHYEAVENVTPAGVSFSRQYEVLTKRSKIKRRTLNEERWNEGRRST
jgi:hypothetical protein